MNASESPDLTTVIGLHLPYLRRYARALTGSQSTGDRYAAATLEAIIAGQAEVTDAKTAKVALFHAFHRVWSSAGAPVGEPDTTLSARAQDHMIHLTPNSREALLLHAIEEFTAAEISVIMEVTTEEAADFITIARKEMEISVAGDVLVIEDEAIIALDIAGIVTDMGHRVTGIARTRSEAVQLASAQRPGLILADIQLADNSSGIDAVNDILSQFQNIPVIFITAFSARLLTGKGPEPTFLINKPFTEEQLRSAVSQAMFFSSTETLVV